MKRSFTYHLSLWLTVLAVVLAAVLLWARASTPAAVESEPTGLVITELMTQNSAVYTDRQGNYCQWIEVKNASDAPVELGEYTLGCGEESCALPARTLAPGELSVLDSGEWGFLIPTRGTLTLSRGKRTVFTLSYDNGGENRSYLVSTHAETTQPTPGYEEVLPPDALVISEVVSDNDSYPVNGSLGDWVELYNAGESTLFLGDFYLSKRAEKPYDCRLPQVTLAAGEYIVLVCGTDLDFNISKAGDALYLTRKDGVGCAALGVPALESGLAYTVDKGVMAPTPGAANAAENTHSSFSAESALRLSEVMLSNTSYHLLAGEGYDLVELYNAGESALELSDYYLSKSKNNLYRWQLPAVSLSPGQYYVAVCSGRGGTEAPFKLSSAGERLYLTRADGYVTDVLHVPAVPNDRSWGRSGGGELVYFSTPTPGAPNGSGYAELSPVPVPSVPSGFYDAPFTVTLSGEGDIYYTTDGNPPQFSGQLYKGEEITVDKSMSLWVYGRNGERIPSECVCYNYFLDMPEYELDIVKISMSPFYFGADLSYDTNVGEFQANVALYSGGEEQFSAGCAISLFGSGSRMYPKKSYQIDFQSGYGPTKLRYQLFENLDIHEFNSFVLRSGAQDLCYATLRDEFITSLFGECSDSLLVQAYRPVSLYVNDQYRGLYYIRERVTDDMVASHYGVSPESVTIVKNMESIPGSTDPTVQELGKLLNFIRSADMSAEENFAYAQEHLDMDSVIDFFIAEMWSTNFDIGNIKFVHSTENDQRWRLVLYDLDVAFIRCNYDSVRLMYTAYEGLLSSLMENEGFLERYTARLAELLAGPLAEETVLARLDAMVARLDHDMRYNCELWSGFKTYEGWLREIEFLRAEPGKGITGWNEQFIEDYIAVVQPDEALVKEYFPDHA